jgi:hypothetical protein
MGEMEKERKIRSSDVIRASEIGQYIYCSKSWYLQRCGYAPDSPMLEVGKKAHVDLGKTINSIQNEIGLSKRFAVIGYLFLLFAILVILYGVILFL